MITRFDLSHYNVYFKNSNFNSIQFVLRSFLKGDVIVVRIKPLILASSSMNYGSEYMLTFPILTWIETYSMPFDYW